MSLTILTDEDLNPINARLTALESVAGQASTEVAALEGRVAALEELTAPAPVQRSILFLGQDVYVDYTVEVTGSLSADPLYTTAGDSGDVLGETLVTGAVNDGDDGYFFTGDIVRLNLSSPDIVVKIDGVTMTSSDYVQSAPPPAEPLPAPIGDVSVVSMDYIGDDSHTYTLGWASSPIVTDPATGRKLFSPVMGNSHNRAGDNSIRGFDPVSGAWTQYQGNFGGSTDWDGYTNVTTACNRDNHIIWYVPWRNELWVVGGAGAVNHGIFDYTTQTWTGLWQSRAAFGTGILANPAALDLDNVFHTFNPAQVVCPERQEMLFFGGEIIGNPQDRLLIVEPNTDTEPLKLTELTGPLAVMRCRNNMCIDGTTAYFTGGTVKDTSGNNVLSLKTYKLDLVTRTWTRLADAPTMTDYPVVTWDAGIKRLIVFSGEGRRLLMSYDPAVDAWTDLSSQLPDMGIKNGCGAYLDGVHYYRGGALYQGGIDQGWSRSRRVHALKLQAAAATSGVTIETVAWADMKPPMKHTKAVEADGRIYVNGGDFKGPGHVESYRQDLYSLDPVAQAWREEHPYCAVAPDVQPKGPDMCGWVFDGTTLRMHPGIQDAAADNSCVGVGGKAMRFDRVTGKWAEIVGQNSLSTVISSTLTDNLPTFWTHDAVTNADYAIGFQGEVLRFDVATAQYSKVKSNPFGISVSPHKQYAALVGRELILLDNNSGKMLAYNIDTEVGRVVNTPPFVPEQENCYVGYLPWRNRLFIHNFDKGNTPNCTSWLYNPADDSYEQLSLVDGAGRVVRARSMCVDVTHQQVVMLGHNDYASWDAPKDPAWLVRL